MAAPDGGVGIAPVTSADSPQTHKSGEPFEYDVAFQCSTVDPPETCKNVDVRIPLGDAKDFKIDTSKLPAGATAEVVDGVLVVHLGDVEPGQSLTFPFSVTPPNLTTEDGTSWTFTPTATIDGLPAGDGLPKDGNWAKSTDSKATTEVNHTVTKTLDGSVFRKPGEEVTWTIVASCTQTAAGSLLADKMTVVDTLPAGFTYVSSTPAATVEGQKATWSLEGDELPDSCKTQGGKGTYEVTITAKIDENVEIPATGLRLDNVVDSTVRGKGEDTETTKTADSAVTVTDDPNPGPGKWGKVSFAQLNDEGEKGNRDESHTTYPGPWNGYVEPQRNNILGSGKPNEPNFDQSGYMITYQNQKQALGYEVELNDPMPCMSAGNQHTSNKPGTYCPEDKLAFHPTTVSVFANSPDNYELPPITDGYHPTAHLSDGTVIDLVETKVNEHGKAWRNFSVPQQYIGKVAELNFPRDPGLASDTIRFGIFGYADSKTEDGDVLTNIGEGSSYYDNKLVEGPSATNPASIFIIKEVAIGIEKNIVPSQVEPGADVPTELTVNLAAPGEIRDEIVATDLLPDGFSIQRPQDGKITAKVSLTFVTPANPSGDTRDFDLPLTVEIVDNYQGTGRQLLRFTLPADALKGLGSIQGTAKLPFTLTAPSVPGVFTNTAQVFYNGSGLSTICNQAPFFEQISDDPLNLGGNSAFPRHCQGQDDLVIKAPEGSAAFSLVKTVQGDTDAAPRVPPAIGTVNEDGGSVTFGLDWKNTGSAPLDNTVLYDIFPVVGDNGVSGSQADHPRHSEFDAKFIAMETPLPAGVTVEYSTSPNPCRPEVYSGEGECANDWSTTVPADPSTVTGVRVTSSATYQTGEGFSVKIKMTSPKISVGEVAWNSVAGVARNAFSGTFLLPAEPPKVGLTAYTDTPAPILQKTADVTEAAPGDTITYKLAVTNPSEKELTDLELADELPAALEFVSASDGGTFANGKVTWETFKLDPWQTRTFEVKAKVVPGTVGQVKNVATIPGSITPEPCDDNKDAACSDINVPGGKVVVNKQVTGDAASFAPKSFEAVLDCRISDASAPGFPQTLNIPGNGASSEVPAPVGAKCSVTEPNTQGATATTITPEQGVDITEASDTAVQLTINNRYDAGSLVIQKSVTGAGADAFGAGPFTFATSCTLNGNVIYTGNTTLGGTAGMTSEPITPLPVGAECVVRETNAGGADQAAAPAKVTIAATPAGAATPTVTTANLVNSFSAGQIAVTKTVKGNAPKNATYVIGVVCNAADGSELARGDVSLAAGATATFAINGKNVLLPAGARCFATEKDSQGATKVTISHPTSEDAAVVATGKPDAVQVLSIDVENDFDELFITGSQPALWLLGGGLFALALGGVLLLKRRNRLS